MINAFAGGFGQLPGITPAGITDIVAKNKELRKKVTNMELLTGIDKVLANGTTGIAKNALVAAQGGLNEVIVNAKEGLDRISIAIKTVSSLLFNAGPFAIAVRGWNDSVTFAETSYTYLSGPTDKLKSLLRMLPASQKVNTDVLHEVERQLLAYAIAIAGVGKNLEIAKHNIETATKGPVEITGVIVRETIKKTGETIRWVLKDFLKGLTGKEGDHSLPSLIPWWVWIAGAGVLALYAAPPIIRIVKASRS